MKKELVITDFLHDDREMKRKRLFFTGVYHDNGMQIITNGRYLIGHHCNYNNELEGKIIARNGEIIDSKFYPKWQTVVPTNKELVECDFFFKKDIYAICKNFTENSYSNIGWKHILIENKNVAFNAFFLKKLKRFFFYYPNAKIYHHKDSLLKSWEIIDKDSGDFFLIMPTAKGAYKYENGKVKTIQY